MNQTAVGFKHPLKTLKLGLSDLAEALPCQALNACWLFVCLVLAAFAVINCSQIKGLRSTQARLQLTQNTINDLVIQSANLRLLEPTISTNERISAARLKQAGYQSAHELAYQIQSRLAILNALQAELPVQLPLQQLNDSINKLIPTDYSNSSADSKRIESSIDQWFKALTQLSQRVQAISNAHTQRSNTLERNNLLLAMAVLVFSVSLAALNIWKRSEMSKRFEFELKLLTNQARTDPLTGVLNRRGWLEYTGKYLKNCQKEARKPASLAVLDIDYFKQYNDTFGHEAGDDRLRHFAAILRQNFRPGDLIARVGGEEFAVMLMNCNVEESRRIVDRIRESALCDIPFSAGLTNIDNHESIIKAMAVADQALYQAKHSGRNCSKIAYH
ncbi:GGDEF domain-containing protein [Limnobacter sp.]|uniref:GGDEF domain-containing protein n=1 Tax=Limnobacter sp. TaxID=2003368 RepID=UPI00258A1970|nr:GGDEF domain-containing protein [Limnobacter sp.]